MDDETTTETETTQTETVEVETAPVVETERKPHPLEPGGPRFEEVYRKLKDSERREDDLRRQLSETKPAPKPEAAQPQYYTQDQLQALLDAGRITPAQMAGQLALQSKELAKQEIKQELRQDTARSSALSEVNDFMAKVPALNDQSSDEFRRVARAAYEIADETGLDVRDPRVQRRALREALGPVDKLTKVSAAREFSREHADTFAERGGGGGSQTRKADPLKDIPQTQKDHWTARGKTKEEQVELAKFWRPRRAG